MADKDLSSITDSKRGVPYFTALVDEAETDGSVSNASEFWKRLKVPKLTFCLVEVHYEIDKNWNLVKKNELLAGVLKDRMLPLGITLENAMLYSMTRDDYEGYVSSVGVIQKALEGGPYGPGYKPEHISLEEHGRRHLFSKWRPHGGFSKELVSRMFGEIPGWAPDKDSMCEYKKEKTKAEILSRTPWSSFPHQLYLFPDYRMRIKTQIDNAEAYLKDLYDKLEEASEETADTGKDFGTLKSSESVTKIQKGGIKLMTKERIKRSSVPPGVDGYDQEIVKRNWFMAKSLKENLYKYLNLLKTGDDIAKTVPPLMSRKIPSTLATSCDIEGVGFVPILDKKRIYRMFQVRLAVGCPHFIRGAAPICTECMSGDEAQANPMSVPVCHFCHSANHVMMNEDVEQMLCFFCGKVGAWGYECEHCGQRVCGGGIFAPDRDSGIKRNEAYSCCCNKCHILDARSQLWAPMTHCGRECKTDKENDSFSCYHCVQGLPWETKHCQTCCCCHNSMIVHPNPDPKQLTDTDPTVKIRSESGAKGTSTSSTPLKKKVPHGEKQNPPGSLIRKVFGEQVNCPICFSPLNDKTNSSPICILRCGHRIHKVCKDFQLSKLDLISSFRCPLCKKLILDEREKENWEQAMLRRYNYEKKTEKPPKRPMMNIICYECLHKWEGEYSQVGQRCEKCQSFNTDQEPIRPC